MTYLAMTIGPIYKTLREAKKTRELWGGSYLFSYLMKKTIEVFQDREFVVPYVKDKTIFDSGQGIGLFPEKRRRDIALSVCRIDDDRRVALFDPDACLIEPARFNPVLCIGTHAVDIPSRTGISRLPAEGIESAVAQKIDIGMADPAARSVRTADTDLVVSRIEKNKPVVDRRKKPPDRAAYVGTAGGEIFTHVARSITGSEDTIKRSAPAEPAAFAPLTVRDDPVPDQIVRVGLRRFVKGAAVSQRDHPRLMADRIEHPQSGPGFLTGVFGDTVLCRQRYMFLSQLPLLCKEERTQNDNQQKRFAHESFLFILCQYNQ